LIKNNFKQIIKKYSKGILSSFGVWGGVESYRTPNFRHFFFNSCVWVRYFSPRENQVCGICY